MMDGMLASSSCWTSVFLSAQPYPKVKNATLSHIPSHPRTFPAQSPLTHIPTWIQHVFLYTTGRGKIVPQWYDTSSFARFACSALLASLAQLLPLHSRMWVIRCRTALCAELLLLDCVRFSCCSLRDCIDPLHLLLPVCIRFSCCSPLVSASAAALNCIRFNCCSPIVSDSTAAPRLRPLLPASCSGRFHPMPNVLQHSSQSSRFSKLKYEGGASLV